MNSSRPETQPIGCILLHKPARKIPPLASQIPATRGGNVSWRRDAVRHVSVTSPWGLSNTWKSARKFERRRTGEAPVHVDRVREPSAGSRARGGAQRVNWTVAEEGLRARAWKPEDGLRVVSHPHFHCKQWLCQATADYKPLIIFSEMGISLKHGNLVFIQIYMTFQYYNYMYFVHYNLILS